MIQKTNLERYMEVIEMDMLSFIMYVMFVLSAIILIFLFGYFIGREMGRRD